MTGSILLWVFVAVFVPSMAYLCVRLIEKLIEKKIAKGIAEFKSEMFVIDEDAEEASKDPEPGDLLWDESKDWVEAARERRGWR